MRWNSKAVISALVEDEKLVFYFFALFSRFEYALKRNGFLRRQERAEADWDAFAESLRDRFASVTASAFREACTYLKDEPPKKQVVCGRDLGWKDIIQGDGESEECYVLRLGRTVRNNLFHGGKYPYPSGPVSDAARNRRLMESCVAVLEECIRLSPILGSAFQETA